MGKALRDHPITLNVAGLAIGAAGGAVFELMGTPIPWLLGSLLTVAAVNLAGWRVRCLPVGRQTGQIFVGAVIGLYFTPTVAVIVVGQLPWMILVAAVALAIGGVGAVVQMRLAKLDMATAFLASIPGGMAEIINLADKLKAEPVPLAVSQLLRVTIILLSIPALLTYLGEPGNDVFTPAVREVDWAMLALLLAGCAATAFALHRAGMTNAWMLGSCAFAALLTVLEIKMSAMPAIFMIIAQVLIGTSVGERFEREAMRRTPLVILSATLTTLILILASVVLAAVISSASGISFWSMIASTAPGGLAEMSVTAQILGLGVPLVTGYHVTRVFMITLLAMPVYRWASKRVGAPNP